MHKTSFNLCDFFACICGFSFIKYDDFFFLVFIFCGNWGMEWVFFWWWPDPGPCIYYALSKPTELCSRRRGNGMGLVEMEMGLCQNLFFFVCF